MKQENNWRQKTLENLEKDVWPALSPDEGSYLVSTCNALRKKPLQEFTTEDLRIMIGQEIGLYFLMPLAIETLAGNLLAEGDLYAGDLLKSVLDVDTSFWNDHQDHWEELNKLVAKGREEIGKMKFDTVKLDSCRHKS